MLARAAAIQMNSVSGDVEGNLDRARALLRDARDLGAEILVLPELAIPGYSRELDYWNLAEPHDGPTPAALRDWARGWRVAIVAGFAEIESGHVYNSIALALPDGALHLYRKRHLVMWEPRRFRAGGLSGIVRTPWGRLGLAVCADALFARTWSEYRGRTDLIAISAAWPEFRRDPRGKLHWLLGGFGGLAARIPGEVADALGVPVTFANQSGPTRTRVPVFGPVLDDRFAGHSGVFDPRGLRRRAETTEEAIVLGEFRTFG